MAFAKQGNHQPEGYNTLKVEPSSYGLFLKFWIRMKGWEYKDAIRYCKMNSAQNLSHWLNHIPQENWNEFDVTRFANAFNIQENYFIAVVEEIERLRKLEKEDGAIIKRKVRKD